MIYDRYANEAEFRSEFIRPLLTRMGFLAVAELHGQNEFGKDFVFSELTPFGFLRHYAAVVKHEEKIGQSHGKLRDEILRQIQDAFDVSFRLPDNEDEHHVSAVFVFNSGKITDNARTCIRGKLDRERYGQNVHILDGERLFQLDLTATFRQGEEILPRLQGMFHDIYLNFDVWGNITDSLPAFVEGRGCFTAALESFMAAPFLTNNIDLGEVSVLIQECRIIDQINGLYLLPIVPHKEKRDKQIEILQDIIAKAEARATKLQSSICAALDSFHLITPAAVT